MTYVSGPVMSSLLTKSVTLLLQLSLYCFVVVFPGGLPNISTSASFRAQSKGTLPRPLAGDELCDW